MKQQLSGHGRSRINFLFFLFLLPFIFTSCKNTDMEQVEAVTSEKRMPLETARNVEILYSDSAKIKARLTAPVLVRLAADEQIMEMPEGIEVNFYDENLEINSMLRANYGIRYMGRRLTEVKDDVFVFNIQGDTLNTEHLFWDEKLEKIYSDQMVRVRTEDEIIFAEGFESDPSFTNYKFYKIRGTIRIKD
jgi:LPS export ABC transporter protein LptC